MNDLPPADAFAGHAARTTRAASSARSRNIAPDCRGLNFHEIDTSLRSLLPLYVDAPLLRHLEPHLSELGSLCGGRPGELADLAGRHEPVLHPRDRYGRDEEWIEFHPAYREMEQIALERFGLHAMTHRPGVLGWPDRMPPVAKYVFHYHFAQAEFGLLCPVNLTDSSSELVRRYGSDETRARYLCADRAASRRPAWRPPIAASASRSRLKRPQPLRVRHFHAAEARPPLIESGISDPRASGTTPRRSAPSGAP